MQSVQASASRNILIISNKDPENSPEDWEFLYLYGNHWCRQPLLVIPKGQLTSVEICMQCMIVLWEYPLSLPFRV